MGQGFLDANPDLRTKLDDQGLSMQAWFEQILRLVYRLIFLAVAEDRDLLHSPGATPAARSLYEDGYGFAYLRERSARRSAHDHHFDAWEGAKIVFGALERGEKLLGLPALGSLFARGITPDLDDAKLPNRAFLAAIFKLSWLMEDNRRVRINWRDMATEELGSVYEGLLELVPVRENHGRRFVFAGGAEAKGTARRISGSYYTPDSLVQTLLDSALDPVLDRAEAEGGIVAILDLNVIDPACGSGHFLLGAARRMATRVAQLRDSDAPDYPAALRDVVRGCIYGVDRNPMAVELAKVALWIETVEPGKPLGFLDANIQCGDSLLGVFDLKALDEGIPDNAYKPLAADDKETAKWFSKHNKDEKSGQGSFDFDSGGGSLPPAKLAAGMDDLRQLPEETVEQVAAKRRRFDAWAEDPKHRATQVACDLYTAAFLLPKVGAVPLDVNIVTVPTTAHVRTLLGGGSIHGPLEAAAINATAKARAFHWPLAFPEVMIARGGFDVVLGNPPWETMSPDAKEFFGFYEPEVRFMAPAEQKATYERLRENPSIAQSWHEYCHDLYAAVHFMKSSGRYRLFAPGNLGKGDFNVYRMFVETALALTREGCVAAQFVPEGFYNGANAAAIRNEIFNHFRLEKLAGFENTKGIWFPSIDTRTKFCLYVAWRGGTTEHFGAAFRVNSMEKLADFSDGRVLTIPTELVAEFSPDAIAVMEFAAQEDIDICRKMYARYPKFSEQIDGLPYRFYMREVDMGNDRRLFSDGPDGLPVFEGRMVDAYDYRAKGHISGHGRSAEWANLPFGVPGKAIEPQWRIVPEIIPDKLIGRIDQYRIGFCDVASPTNSKSLIAALVPPDTICGDKVPTITFGTGDADLLFWIGVANSLAMDFVVRKKVALKMSYTIMDSLPFPRDRHSLPAADEIVERVFKLCAVGDVMDGLRNTASREGTVSSSIKVEEDPDRRAELAAEIDVFVARDIYGLNREEMLYILDPANILGDDCDIETFKALRNRELRDYGEYRTARLVLAAWDRLATPEMGSYETSLRLDHYPFALLSELRDAANEHGFRIGPEQANGWIFFRSASAPGEIAVAAAGQDGPFFLSITHAGVARELSAPPAQPCAKGHAAAFALPTRDALFEAVGEVYRKSVSLPTEPLEQFERDIEHLGNTEAERVQKVRIGQDIFRNALLSYWNGTCPITGITDTALLRASHIIPWAQCETDADRLDVHNGLLLSSLWDAAFDEGLVTFDDEGRPIASSDLTDAAIKALHLQGATPLLLTPEHHVRLAWHRTHVWQG